MGCRLLLWFAVGAHFAFLAYGVFGGFLSWRWPRTIGLHLASALWLFAIVVFSWRCPLTWLEDRSRQRLGLAPRPGGFLANHVAGVFYPQGAERTAQLVVALIVLISWAGLVVLLVHRRRRRIAQSHAGRVKASIGPGAPPGRGSHSPLP